ncbi:hypothetical protein FRC07_010540 [Ceratobasidium sp. 392]|nr:hypothetical protein FRC07_010540 [Ceratobasidium sp. 392]
MAKHLVEVDEELSGLQRDVEQHRSTLPALERMKYILDRCKNDTSQALAASGTFRDQHQQLTTMMTQAHVNTKEARQLTLDVQRLSGALFSQVSSIKKSLDDINVEAQSIQATIDARPNTWWGKIWAWFRQILFSLWRKISELLPSLKKAIDRFCDCLGVRIFDNYVDISRAEWHSVSERIATAQDSCTTIAGFQGALNETTEKTLSVLDENDALKAEIE